MAGIRICISLISVWAFFFSGTKPVDAPLWDFVKEKDGIRIFTRRTAQSNFKELKMETVFKGRISSFVAVIQDLSSYHRWVYSTRNTRKLKQISANEIIYYAQSDLPWPLTDRDFVIYNKIWQDNKTNTFHSLSESRPDLASEQEDFIRVRDFIGKWVFRHNPNGTTGLVYTLKIDPAGQLPAWLVNMAIDVGPMKTLQSLQQIVQEPKYRNATFDFISEPVQKF